MLIISEKLDIVEQVESQLLAIKKAYQSDANFRTFMTHPKIPRSAKRDVLRQIFAEKLHPVFIRFMEILVDKHRFAMIEHIADAFDELADRSKGIVRVVVTSPFPLAENHTDRLHKCLTSLTAGKKIELHVELDKKTLGGISVRVGDTLVDGTVQNKLKRLREELMSPQVLGGIYAG